MFTSSQLLDKINTHVEALRFSRSPKRLYAPVEYVLSMGGKRIRPLLMLMAYNLYKEDVERVYGPATGVEVYHNYTLLHDDLMDNADMRRGKAAVHKVWDDNTAILSGDAMLVLAYQYIADCPVEHLKEVLDLFSQTALEICEGQQMDMDFELRDDVLEEEYIEMIRLKTAVLLATILKVGAILGDASREDADSLYRFGIQIGVAFQLQDDLLDVYGDAAVFGKNIGGDIICNKKTYMLIKALQHADKDQQLKLKNWLSAEQFEPSEKIESVTQLYDEIGVKAVCENLMQQYYEAAMKSLSAVNVPEEKKSELILLTKSLMCREL